MKKPSPEDFVRAWQGASTLADAAKATGMSLDRARSTAHRLRAKGAPLKKFHSPREWVGVGELVKLRRLAEELAPLGSEETKETAE